MAKLYFYYSSMNAGKSASLLQSSYNYQERGLSTLLLCPALDDRYGENQITSRIGISAPATGFAKGVDLFELVTQKLSQNVFHCVMVDEAQFLSKEQVRQLIRLVDEEGIPVLTYGIRSDFKGEVFEGSKFLLAWSDVMKEIKTICHCGKKATMNARVSTEGDMETAGAQIEIGGNERYISLCRSCFNRGETGSFSPV